MPYRHAHVATAACRLASLATRLRTLAASSAASLGMLAFVTPAHAGHYNYTQIFAGTSPFACATGINEHDDVVGEYYGSGDAPYGGYVFYSGVGAFEFNPPNGTGLLDSCGYVPSISNINDSGLTVSTYASDVFHGFAPFTYKQTSETGGKTKKLPRPARISMPTAMNNSGVVVGAASGGATASPFWDAHGFMISNGLVTEFDPPGSTNTTPTDIADDGTIVGYFTDAAGIHGFISGSNGAYTVIDAPGSKDTEIRSINSAGEVAGEYFDGTAGHYVGFTRSGTNLVSYQYPGAGDTVVVATLPNGMRFGNYTDSSFVQHAFSYLGGAYSTLSPAGVSGFTVQAVNRKGDFVGNAGQPLGGQAFLAVCAPGTGVCLD